MGTAFAIIQQALRYVLVQTGMREIIVTNALQQQWERSHIALTRPTDIAMLPYAILYLLLAKPCVTITVRIFHFAIMRRTFLGKMLNMLIMNVHLRMSLSADKS